MWYSVNQLRDNNNSEAPLRDPQIADKALVAQIPAARISLIISFVASLNSGGICVW